MVPAASNQGLDNIFDFVGACARPAQWFGHNCCQGSNSLVVKAQGVSASSQCPVFQLIRLHRCQRAYAIEVAELEDGQKEKKQRKETKEKYILGRARPGLLSFAVLPHSSHRGVTETILPTIVSLKKVNTAGVAL